ncbi:UDP-4-amino-4,6-dideoxy-N-acetyl-beta-L-altrosamine transaminase [Thermoanaerobacterium sp. CMT5567-10]|uniref:UDP-4-amino-4, 6-dideoxy-N-acetyl-beta-L-altrosamine transaminase n=1 Tax=Thermoanaerobacterium sp. CMT5567-10 TaxID=3061989 RepID=UPI0026DEA2F0|nr:UDP-4-amino-4,6-dideoxy-N-acetyl-beta-L-altrosamine transaminase [Thermoanaerobacterium sp. CMT5567-10]WKV09846.1 UDP-4-amino-4,6-dideoxy-N-acetyl-beta-L-altrosamine transaminase [Thermoanaerobacterium sp. CMT5567-10]
MDRLAIKGGKPVRKTYLPYGRQWIDDEDIEEVIETLKSDYITTGPKIKEFEEKVAAYTGTKYAVAISNGTAALHAACFAAGVRPGDEVITTPMTFAASANCILYCGAKPVFADIDPQTYNINPEDIKRKITSKTKAIIPVHYTGQPVDIDEINKIAKQYGLIVIEDGAHALGAEYKGEKVGSQSDMMTLSFHPVKHITTGEGGMVLTNSKDFYEKLKLFRTHGITRDENLLTKNEGPWYYEQQYLGYNYRMTDIQAALGISQMNKLNKFLELRRKYAQMYNDAFKDIEELIIPYQLPYTNSSWHIYVLQLRLEKLKVGRREVYEALLKENIGVNVHYIPVYYHPYYQRLGYKKGLCPNAEHLYERIITLPLFPKMTEEDINDVIEAVKKVINYYKK